MKKTKGNVAAADGKADASADAKADAKADASADTKKKRGQFYTVRTDYILDTFQRPPAGTTRVVEPFAGAGDLLVWLKAKGWTGPVEAYDIEPKYEGVEQRDTLTDPPSYSGAWVLTNPPYLARNKNDTKEIYDRYDTNDLYKCFLLSLCAEPVPAQGGLLILPVGFFLSPRNVDVRCRSLFLERYRITAVRYFEEDVFPDTSTTVVAFTFEAAGETTPLRTQTIPWVRMPMNEQRDFTIGVENDWIIGGDIYRLTEAEGVSVGRYVEGVALKEAAWMSGLTLTALDSGKEDGRIQLNYKEGYVYPAKDTSRSYATLWFRGCRQLTAGEQEVLAERFNALVEEKREETWSLFLPQYRESKEYARKRIPFELAYTIILHLLKELLP
jgi:hypothetical protein